MITFDINGATVEFDENKDNYNKVRRLFKIYAQSASSNFEQYCCDNALNNKQISETGLELGLNFIEDGLKKAIETIISFGVMTIDMTIFKTKYCNKYLNYERLFNNLHKDKLSNSKNRRNNSKIYDKKIVISQLSKYIYNDCFNIHYAIVDALIENNINKINSSIDEEEKEKANALFNNYKDGFINQLDECRVIKKIIELNPYREDVYKFLVKEDGDFNKEIEKLTEYLGYDIKPFKSELMDIYVEEIIKDKTIDIEVNQEKVTKYAKYIGCGEYSIYLARIDAIYTFENA